MDIYEPQEDSYLLASVMQSLDLKDKKVLDMGTGSGILAMTAYKQGAHVTAVDCNKQAIAQLPSYITGIHSDMCAQVNQQFDVIVCNSPYLPQDNREQHPDIALVGGKQGYEWCVRFLDQAHNCMTTQSTLYLLFSSLSKPETILAHAQHYYIAHCVATQHLFFETLYVYAFTLNDAIKKLRHVQVQHIRYLNEGQHGVIYTGEYQHKQVACKLPKVGTLHKEVEALRLLYPHGIAPQLYAYEQGVLIRAFVEGICFEQWEKTFDKPTRIEYYITILKQCFIMDSMKLEKQEMMRPHKHVFAHQNTITMIDFERCHHKKNPSNVTQWLQWLWTHEYMEKQTALVLGKQYKEEYSQHVVDALIEHIVTYNNRQTVIK
ncbi:MAG: HemK2/MTQ2 family protein methyltransferase [Candidatus Woesearchaeota archaeon]